MGYVQTCVEISISCEVRVVEIAQFHTQWVTLGSLRNLVIRTISNPPDYTDRVIDLVHGGCVVGMWYVRYTTRVSLEFSTHVVYRELLFLFSLSR
jgi:hypothetical protein